jgi:hypothetical protein
MRGVEPAAMETITQQYPAQAASMLPEATRITNDAAQMLGSDDQTAIMTSAMVDRCRPRLVLAQQSQAFGAIPRSAVWRGLVVSASSRYH